MRISFRTQYDGYLANLGRTESMLFDAQRQVTTGKRIQSVGDDPFGVSASLSMRSLRSGLEQYGKNLTAAKGTLSIAEGALVEVGNLTRRASELAISGANGATTQAGRQAMAQEVDSMIKRLVDLGNTQGPSGEYVFAGQSNDAKPFQLVGSTLNFSGDNLNVNAEISAGETMPINIPAGDLVSGLYQSLSGLKASLEGGNTAALNGIDLPAMQAADRSVQHARGEVGARLKTIGEFQSQHLRRTDELTGQISNVEDVDMSEAIMRYKQAEVAYQAALQTVSATSKLSLMDFMR